MSRKTEPKAAIKNRLTEVNLQELRDRTASNRAKSSDSSSISPLGPLSRKEQRKSSRSTAGKTSRYSTERPRKRSKKSQETLTTRDQATSEDGQHFEPEDYSEASESPPSESEREDDIEEFSDASQSGQAPHSTTQVSNITWSGSSRPPRAATPSRPVSRPTPSSVTRGGDKGPTRVSFQIEEHEARVAEVPKTSSSSHIPMGKETASSSSTDAALPESDRDSTQAIVRMQTSLAPLTPLAHLHPDAGTAAASHTLTPPPRLTALRELPNTFEAPPVCQEDYDFRATSTRHGRVFGMPPAGYTAEGSLPVTTLRTPDPGDKIPAATFRDPRCRITLLLNLLDTINDPRLDNRSYLFERYAPTSVVTLLDILTERINSAESAFYQMAISTLHEAVCGRSPQPSTPCRSLQDVRLEIIKSVGTYTTLEEVLQSRPLSSFSPLFMTLVRPSQYKELFAALGFQNLDRLPWTSPPEMDGDIREYASTLEYYASDHTAHDTVASGASAIATNVYGHRLSHAASRCIEQQLLGECVHPLDILRLQAELKLFQDHRMAPDALVAATRQYLYVTRQPILLSRDSLTSTCTHGMLRLVAAWSSARDTQRFANESTLIKIILGGCGDTAFECQVSNPDVCWGISQLPWFTRAAWFLNHRRAPEVYDLDGYVRATEGEKRQYELGLMYYLLDDRDYQENLPDNMVLRFCIAQAGGVRQPDAEKSHPFDSSVVLVAPPLSLPSLFKRDRFGNTAAPRVMCTPLASMLTPQARREALEGEQPDPSSFEEYAQLLTRDPAPAPLMATGVSPLNHRVSLITVDIWERQPGLNQVEATLRAFYLRFKAHMREQARESSVRDVNPLRRTAERGDAERAVQTTHRHERREPRRVPGVYYGDGVEETREYDPQVLYPPQCRGMLGNLPALSRPTSTPSFLQLAIRGFELMATVPFGNLSAAPRDALVDKFAFYTKFVTIPPTLGELFMITLFETPGVMDRNFTATWADVISGHTALYRVTQLSERTFSATFQELYAAPLDAPLKTWPKWVHALPYPNPAQPSRPVFAPAGYPDLTNAESDSTPGSDGAPDGDDTPGQRGLPGGVQPVPLHTVGRTNSDAGDNQSSSHRPSGNAPSRRRAADYYSQSSSSDSDSSTSTRERRSKHTPERLTDRGGRSVLYNKSTTTEKMNETTAIRVLNDPAQINELLREQGNFLNNYSFETFLVGAAALYRNRQALSTLYQVPGGGIVASPAMALAWYTHKAVLKDIPKDILYWNWTDYLTVTTTSPRLVHLLPTERVKNLTNNELGSWFDFTDALLGLERTYGLFYQQPWENTFHEFHQFVVRHQIGALLSVDFLEYWLLDILAFIRRAARDPSQPITPSDTAKYPRAVTTLDFTPHDWCSLLASEFHARLAHLSVANNENFTRSLRFPVPLSVAHPYGTFAEKTKSPTTPAPAAAVAPVTPASTPVSKSAKKAAKKKEKKAQRKAEAPAPVRTPPRERLCLHSFCAHYKIPLVAADNRTGGIPQKCKQDCPYQHVNDIPAGTTKATLLEKHRRSLDKLLTPADVATFVQKFNADSRLP